MVHTWKMYSFLVSRELSSYPLSADRFDIRFENPGYCSLNSRYQIAVSVRLFHSFIRLPNTVDGLGERVAKTTANGRAKFKNTNFLVASCQGYEFAKEELPDF